MVQSLAGESGHLVISMDSYTEALVDLEPQVADATTRPAGVREIRELAVARPAVGVLERSRIEVDQLVEAAWTVLARNDFDGLKIKALLNEAGLSTQAFYRHFRSKSELMLALGEQVQRVLARRLEAEVERAPTAVDAVRACIAVIVGIPFDDRTAPCSRLLLDRWPALISDFPEVAESCERRLLDPLERAVSRGCDEGVFSVLDPAEAALAIYELCTGVLYTAPIWARRGTRDDAVRFVMRAVEALLGSKDGCLAYRAPDAGATTS